MKTSIPNLNLYELNQFYHNICVEIMKGEDDNRAKDEMEELNRLFCEVYGSLIKKEKQRRLEIRAMA